MQLFVGQWETRFKHFLAQARQNVLIISPFVSQAAVKLLRPLLENRQVSCKVITRLKLYDFRLGVSDHNAMGELIRFGAVVKSLKGLHAKVYIFDRDWAVLTSANFTAGGLNNNHEWGLLVSCKECPQIFDEAEALWLRLTKTLQPRDVSSIDETLKEYLTRHP